MSNNIGLVERACELAIKHSALLKTHLFEPFVGPECRWLDDNHNYFKCKWLDDNHNYFKCKNCGVMAFWLTDIRARYPESKATLFCEQEISCNDYLMQSILK